MIRMYYLSTAAEGLTAADYDQILTSACKNNKAIGVTGLLVVKGRFFAQALEGEEKDVMPLFEKIKSDKRHFRVVILSKTEVEERIFCGWEMSFKDISHCESCKEIELDDKKYVEDPALLDRAFRCILDLELVN